MKNLITFILSGAVLLGTVPLMAQSSDGYYNTNSTTPAMTAPSAGINWLTTYSEAVAQSQSTSKPIVILFTGTTWCPACMNLEREVIKKPEFAQLVGNKFIFLKAEMPGFSSEASPFKPLVERYGINAYPSIVVVNANGQLLYRVNYRQGGPRAYADELLQKLGQPDQGYYQ